MVKERVAVVGGGYMGGGIAQVFALAGAEVRIADVTAELAAQQHDRLIREARQFEKDGLLPQGAAARIAANLRAAASVEEAVDGATFVEEAVPERIEIKHGSLSQISKLCPSDVVIGSNTSTIAIATLAEAVAHPGRFLGVHFSNPAPFIPGVELIPHASTDPATVERAAQLVAMVGKSSAVVNDATGFVLNRLQYALFHEATQLVDDGVATPEAIDTIVRTTFGFRLPFFGPFAIADMAGLDVYAFCYASLQGDFPERFATPAILQDLVDAGKLGLKSGGGFLDVPAERSEALVSYRNRAYAKMALLLEELGPAPIA